jgi:signal transduction histidine kinase
MTTTPMPLLTVAIRQEHDVVVARQRTMQIARLVGFESQDQVRIATAVSEIARNVIHYAGQGRAAFRLDREDGRAVLHVEVSDHGPGIADVDTVLSGRYESPTGMGVGITGARRLMDDFDVDSRPREGTRVSMRKRLPATAPPLDGPRLASITQELAQTPAPGALAEVRQQNEELMRSAEELRRRQEELARLNRELEETNRGVVALYAELDEKAEHLRRADEMKSRFLSHMSHEFRTPLNSILAISRLLQDRTDGDLTGEQEKQVGFIRRAAQELTEMVNDLLDLAKVEAGKTEVHVAPLDVAKLLGTLRGLMRPLATSDAVRLVFEEPPADLGPVKSDEAKVAQVLRNFISNALKFTEHGEVRIRVSREGGEVVFSVTDTGIGIAREDHEKVFQEFAQVESPLQRRVKGTGLGLALSRKLAELLGGRITMDSAPGRGSTFALHLPAPVARPASAPAPPRVAPPSPARSGRILVVDDDPASRYALARLVGNFAGVEEAPDGAAGLQRIRAEPPSAVVLDLVMPGLGGLEVLEALRADDATRDVPVVVATSKVLTDEERLRLAGWRVPILPKSALSRDEAVHEVRDALRRAGWIG